MPGSGRGPLGNWRSYRDGHNNKQQETLMPMRVLSMIAVLSMIVVLSMLQPLLGGEPLEERPVLDAIPTPLIFQNPFMAANNFSEIHLNAYQTDTTSTSGPASASRQA